MASTLSPPLSLLPLLLLSLLSLCSGQDIPPCASNLVGCAAYLTNSSTPPSSCCGPLQSAAKTQTACLCGLLSNKDLLKTFNVTVAQGMDLAKRCDVKVDSAACSKASAPSSSSAGTPAVPASSNSTGTDGKPTTNAAQKAGWTAVNGIIILLFTLLGLITV